MPGRTVLIPLLDAGEPHSANRAEIAYENNALSDSYRACVPWGAVPSTKSAPARGITAPGQARQRSKGCLRPLSFSPWLLSQPLAHSRKSRSSSMSRSWQSRPTTRCNLESGRSARAVRINQIPASIALALPEESALWQAQRLSAASHWLRSRWPLVPSRKNPARSGPSRPSPRWVSRAVLPARFRSPERPCPIFRPVIATKTSTTPTAISSLARRRRRVVLTTMTTTIDQTIRPSRTRNKISAGRSSVTERPC